LPLIAALLPREPTVMVPEPVVAATLLVALLAPGLRSSGSKAILARIRVRVAADNRDAERRRHGSNPEVRGPQ
jgi:hypothetical protein